VSRIKAPKITVNGETWKRFYSDPKIWEPKGECYHEDEVFWVDGEECDCESRDMEAVPDTAKVGVISGTYYDKDQESHDLVDVFLEWVKEDKRTAVEKVLVSKAHLEALEQCYKALVDAYGTGPFRDDTNETRAILAVKASEVGK
jgi:hypothetical protein